MIDDLDRAQFQAFALSTRAQVAIVLIFVGVAASAVMLAAKPRTSEEAHEPEVFSRLLRTTGLAHRLVFLRRKIGLGTSIINALAQQLEARVDVVSSPQGTSVLATHATFAKIPDKASQVESLAGAASTSRITAFSTSMR